MVTPEVQEAIDEIAENHPGQPLSVMPDGQGGAFVILDGLALGCPYSQPDTWTGFHITQSCPYSDVYPHFVRADLTRIDGGGLGEGLSVGHSFPPPGAAGVTNAQRRPAIQVSRRSNKRDNTSDLETPLLKMLKVLRWLKSR